MLAQNWIPLLKNTPFERFDDEDLKLFLDNARKALDQGRDGETHAWDNPATRHRGDVTVLRTTERDGRTCKRVRVRNEADGRKGDTPVTACKVDGKWRLVTQSQAKKK